MKELKSYNIPADLVSAKTLIYDALNYKLSELKPEQESQGYGACTFTLNNLSVKFRTAKITPTKAGQFVTLWKRNEKGITCPHDLSDTIDFYVISVRDKTNFGQFIFSRSVLIEEGIISRPGKEGKRGFRVYPPWDKTDNKQSQKTQNWQFDFFLDIKEGTSLNMERIETLYSKK